MNSFGDIVNPPFPHSVRKLDVPVCLLMWAGFSATMLPRPNYTDLIDPCLVPGKIQCLAVVIKDVGPLTKDHFQGCKLSDMNEQGKGKEKVVIGPRPP